MTVINSNNGGNTIKVVNRLNTPGFTVNNDGVSMDYFTTSLTINTLDATGGIDSVNLSGLTGASGLTT
jgi:hypothetical protein